MSKKSKVQRWILNIVMWLVTALFASPFYVLIVYAFKPREATMLKNPLSLPDSLYLNNFVEAIEKSDFFNAFKNSMISTVSIRCESERSGNVFAVVYLFRTGVR